MRTLKGKGITRSRLAITASGPAACSSRTCSLLSSAPTSSTVSGPETTIGPAQRDHSSDHVPAGPHFVNTDHSASPGTGGRLPHSASAGAQPKAAMTIMGDWAAGEFTTRSSPTTAMPLRLEPTASIRLSPTPSVCRRLQAEDRRQAVPDPPRLRRRPGHLQPVQGFHPANTQAGTAC